mmetsp:Transcript_5431/g.18455  ORF Transcript_5431/g.18455 Transcript_5431/m.18455 type:complete len:122 (-) Transcript_5431:416-781(-)
MLQGAAQSATLSRLFFVLEDGTDAFVANFLAVLPMLGNCVPAPILLLERDPECAVAEAIEEFALVDLIRGRPEDLLALARLFSVFPVPRGDYNLTACRPPRFLSSAVLLAFDEASNVHVAV